MSGTGLLAALRMGFARIIGARAAVAAVAALGVVVLVSVLERSASQVGAADRALATTFRFVVPLVAVVLSGLSTGVASLREAAWPASRFGHPRGMVGLGIVIAATVVTAALSLGLALVALAVTRLGANAGAAALPFARDLLTTSWIALLGGGAYGAWLGLGAGFGAQGGGRLAFLGVDFLLGGLSAAGVVLPRGLLRHLLGGAAPLDLPQAASSAILLVTTACCLALCFARSRD